MPEPIPRPTRFLFSFAFLGARKLERLRIAMLFLAQRRLTPGKPTRMWMVLLVDDPDEVRNLLHHAVDRGRIFTLDNLIQPREAQTLDGQLLLLRRADHRTKILKLDLCCLCHNSSPLTRSYNSSTVLPRPAATSALSRSCVSASNVA